MQTLAFTVSAIAGLAAAYIAWRIVYGKIPAPPIHAAQHFPHERRNRVLPDRLMQCCSSCPPCSSADIAQNATLGAKAGLLKRSRQHVRDWAIPVAGIVVAAAGYAITDNTRDHNLSAAAFEVARVRAIANLAQCPPAQAGDTDIIVASISSADAHTDTARRSVSCWRVKQRIALNAPKGNR